MVSFDEELNEIFDKFRRKMDEILEHGEKSSEKIVNKTLNETTKQRYRRLSKTKTQKLNLNLIFEA